MNDPAAVEAGEIETSVVEAGEIHPLFRGAPTTTEFRKLRKRLVREVALQSDRDLLDQANARLIAALRVSPEGQEGLSAFLDKREAAWIAAASDAGAATREGGA